MNDTTAVPVDGISNTARWTGRVLSTLAVLFLTFDTVVKLLQVAFAVEATVALGYPAAVVPVIGIIQLICLVLYLWPRTAIVGAVLWVGYLGGAIATHLRVGSPLLSHTVFPIYIAVLLWLGLWLRDVRTRGVVRDALD